VNGQSDQFFFRGWRECYRLFDREIVKQFKAGKDFVADFDLVSFYELIDHKLLENILRRRVKDLELLELLCRCLEKWAENHRGIQLHHGIPQGPEPSAFLAECVLFEFDAIRFKNVAYLRYIDDNPRSPFKTDDGFTLLKSETESADADIARYCANLLLDRWPWTSSTWKPTENANRSVKLFLKSLGLRVIAPNRRGVLEAFFTNKMRISVKFRWKKALGSDWRDAERRCLRVQQFDAGDPVGF
jgi:hypothetical protein